MTLLGMIVTTVVTLIIIAGSFYLGKFFGYMRGVQDVLKSFTGIDIKQIVKNELKELAGGKSE